MNTVSGQLDKCMTHNRPSQHDLIADLQVTVSNKRGHVSGSYYLTGCRGHKTSHVPV